jgi:hypothetical protein
MKIEKLTKQEIKNLENYDLNHIHYINIDGKMTKFSNIYETIIIEKNNKYYKFDIKQLLENINLLENDNLDL